MKKSNSHNQLYQKQIDQYEQIFESMEEMFQVIELVYDKNGKAIDYYYLQVNSAFEKLVQKKKEDLVGNSAKEVFGIIEDYWIELYEKVESTGNTENFENYGKELDKYYSIKAWKTGDKKVAILFTDITEKKKADGALKKSETRYRRLFETAKDAILILDSEGKIIDSNPFIQTLLGYSNKDLIDKQIWEISPFSDIVENKEKFFELQKNKYVRYEHLPLKSKSGEIKHVEFISNIYSINNHSVIQCNIRDISDRVKSETELKQKEKKYGVIFNQAAVGVAIVDLDGAWLEINEKLCDIVGYTREELLSRTIYDTTHPDDLRIGMDDLIQLLTNKTKTFSREERFLKKSGDTVWVNLTVSLVLDNNNTDYFIAIIENITEQKLMTLEKSNLAKFPSENPNPVLRISNDGTILYANNSAEDILKSWNTSVHNRVPGKWKQILKEVILSEELLTTEEIINDKIYLFSAMPIKFENYVNLYGRDITERQQAEKLLIKFKTAIEKLEVTIIITDRRGNIEYANPFFTKLTGYSKEEYLGKNPKILKTDDQPQEFYKKMWDTINSGKTWEGEFHNRKKNGELYWENAVITPIQNNKELIKNFVAIKTDITEKKKMEEQLRQSQKMDAIGQLAGGVAHDFNNMLSGIMGSAELILYKVGDNQKLSKYTNLIIDSCSQAAELTQKLLYFSHKEELVCELFDIHDSIKQIYSMLYRSIDKRIELKFIKKAENSMIKGDQSQIQNAILNFGLNSRDAMPDGGELIFATANVDIETVDIDPELNIKPGKYIEIDITDTGSGINEEVKSRIFDPFFTTKGLGKGTGLGLSVAYNTIKVNRGFIKLYSEIGIGTVMKVFLPVVFDRVSKAKRKKEKPVSGHGLVLVVDDESSIRFVVGEMLIELGYDPLFAANGEECVKLYKEKGSHIDLVILDMIMPKMNGKDVFYKLKAINPSVKVLISSGFTQDIHSNKLIEDGASDFIKKPYKQLELSKKVGGILL